MYFLLSCITNSGFAGLSLYSTSAYIGDYIYMYV